MKLRNEKMRARLGDSLHVLQATPPRFPKLPGRLQRKVGRTFGLKSAHLWRVDEWFDEGLIPQVRCLQAKESFDSVLIEYMFLSKLAINLPACARTIIDTHDLMGDRHKRYLQPGMRPQWFPTTRAEEIAALNRAKAVLAILAAYLPKCIAWVISSVLIFNPYQTPEGPVFFCGVRQSYQRASIGMDFGRSIPPYSKEKGRQRASCRRRGRACPQVAYLGVIARKSGFTSS